MLKSHVKGNKVTEFCDNEIKYVTFSPSNIKVAFFCPLMCVGARSSSMAAPDFDTTVSLKSEAFRTPSSSFPSAQSFHRVSVSCRPSTEGAVFGQQQVQSNFENHRSLCPRQRNKYGRICEELELVHVRMWVTPRRQTDVIW
jgi:hypothetical protein